MRGSIDDRLRCVVIADPSRETAEQLASMTERLANERLIATNGADARQLVVDKNPELVLLSLELKHPDAIDVATAVRKNRPELFLIGTFRELAVNRMESLDRAGFEEFLPQPIDVTQIFRLASQRFKLSLRQHARYDVTLEVYRPDGVMIGKTRDLSAGGLMLDCTHPVQVEQSMMLLISLGDTPESRLRVRGTVVGVVGAAPQPVAARVMFQNLRGEEYRRLTGFFGSLAKDAEKR